MSPPPTRSSREAESDALLSSHEHNDPSDVEAATKSHKPPRWQFWNQPTHNAPFSAEDDEVDTLPTMKSDRRNVQQALIYAALLLVGAGIGALAGRGVLWRRASDGLGDGPMVPPVFKLPPVSDIAYFG